MRRSETFNEQISRHLKDPKFAREFIFSLLEGPDAMSAENALRKTIEIMGIKEFSKLAGVAPSNVVAFVKGRRNLKTSTLDLLLKPFKLKVKMTFEKAG